MAVKGKSRIPELMQSLRRIDGQRVAVGLLGSSGSDLATYAAANEFGTSNIPERSFLRSAIDGFKEKLKSEIRKFNLMDPARSVNRIGVVAVEAVRKMIRSNIPPALNPETIRRKKGSERALIDTGRMIQAVKHEVR